VWLILCEGPAGGRLDQHYKARSGMSDEEKDAGGDRSARQQSPGEGAASAIGKGGTEAGLIGPKLPAVSEVSVTPSSEAHSTISVGTAAVPAQGSVRAETAAENAKPEPAGVDAVRELLQRLEAVAAKHDAEPQRHRSSALGMPGITEKPDGADIASAESKARDDDTNAVRPLILAQSGTRRGDSRLTADQLPRFEFGTSEEETSGGLARPRMELSTLRRSGSITRLQIEALPDIRHAPPEPRALPDFELTTARRKSPLAPALAFLVGAVAASALAYVIDPWKRWAPSSTTVATPSAQSSPTQSTPRSSARDTVNANPDLAAGKGQALQKTTAATGAGGVPPAKVAAAGASATAVAAASTPAAAKPSTEPSTPTTTSPTDAPGQISDTRTAPGSGTAPNSQTSQSTAAGPTQADRPQAATPAPADQTAANSAGPPESDRARIGRTADASYPRNPTPAGRDTSGVETRTAAAGVTTTARDPQAAGTPTAKSGSRIEPEPSAETAVNSPAAPATADQAETKQSTKASPETQREDGGKKPEAAEASRPTRSATVESERDGRPSATPPASQPPANTSTPQPGKSAKAAPAIEADTTPIPPAQRSSEVAVGSRPKSDRSARTAMAPESVAKPEAAKSVETPASVSTGDRNKQASTVTGPVSYLLTVPAELELEAGKPSRLPLRLDPVPDEAANLLLIVRGLPEWLKLSKGSAIGDDVWVLSAHEAHDLMLRPTTSAAGSAELRLELATSGGRRLSAVITQIKAAGSVYAVPAPVLAKPRPDAKAEAVLHLIAGGDILLDAGELPEARARYRRAAEAGSADAAMRLASTYDMNEITRLGLTAAAVDKAQARRWYLQAQKLGAADAKDRLRNLGRQ
jgi:hypothetical protein